MAIVENQLIKVKWNYMNRKHYESKGYKFTKNGDVIIINVNDISPYSRMIVKFECDNCKRIDSIEYYKKSNNKFYFCNKKCRKEFRECQNKNNPIHSIETSCVYCNKVFLKRECEFKGHGKHYCSRFCLGKHRMETNNPNPSKDKIITKCNNCNCKMEVVESVYKLNNHNFCSKNCYAEFRSKYYVGENSPSYNGLKTNCDTCGKEFSVIKANVNKNKNMFCSRECYAKFRSIHYSGKNHNQYGIKKSPEQLKKMSMSTSKRISKGLFPQTNSSINIKIDSLLRSMNIKFINEKLFKYYSVDFYLPDHNIIIEVNGDYWHANPLKYKKFNELSKIQKKDVKRDKSKNTYLKKYHNCRILYLWECDVNNNIDLCEKLIRYTIDNEVNDVNSINYNLISSELLRKESITTPYFLIKN